MMVGKPKMTSKTNLADIFPTLGSIRARNFVLRKDCRKWTFGDACSAINASIRINVHPRIFLDRFTRHDAFHRAYFYAASVA
jgi:hypothetical protein